MPIIKSSGIRIFIISILALVHSHLSFALQGVISDSEPHFGPDAEIHFAAVGDYGTPGVDAEQVAQLIKSWNPDFIITQGDNNYDDGEADTIDRNIGRLFHEYIGQYHGEYGSGSSYPRFFPSLGNHDWDCKTCLKLPLPYLEYFSLGGNERYYDFVEGPVHFFVIDSDKREPDGVKASSVQGQWLKNQMAKSTSSFNIVTFHNPPFSSGNHGDNKKMQWPFKKWGASAVLSGHDHIYERYSIGGVPYFVNGLGGRERTQVGPRRATCLAQYDQDYGAMKITATVKALTFEFFTKTGKLIDQYVLPGKS